MSDIAIRVENLGKMFRIGGKSERYKTFRDTLAGFFRKTGARRQAKNEPFWALKDVSFEINRGEVVGVIGRNGAGKSTLLKVLSRITEPTNGSAEIHGRVGSLLEVGTGFHPELTGRENVFLNGAILGMKRTEIDRNFDDIVAFAELERFVDTPVKHYSSGMYLRLAFSVAAHLNTQILLVDEVLAVGDARFQKKCLGKMEDVAKNGRTVVFVSHNMSAIKNLCRTGILLANGKMAVTGDIAKAIYGYQNAFEESSTAGTPNRNRVSLDRIHICGNRAASITLDTPFAVAVTLKTAIDIRGYYLFFILQDCYGNTIVHSRVTEEQFEPVLETGDNEVKLTLPALWITPGIYTAQFKLIGADPAAPNRCLSDPLMIEVQGETLVSNTSGILTPNASWQLKKES